MIETPAISEHAAPPIPQSVGLPSAAAEVSTLPWLTISEWNKLELETTAQRLAAVAHPLRLAIVCLLSQSERSVNEICEALWTSQPNISQHLNILHNRNLIKSRKEANRIFYSLSDDKLRALLPLICCVGKAPETLS